MPARFFRTLLTSHRQIHPFTPARIYTRTFHSTMAAPNGIALAQRMKDGGTDKLDVWSIFTYVSAAAKIKDSSTDLAAPPTFHLIASTWDKGS